MRPDGSDLERLTDSGLYDTGPSVSPDGAQIVFVRSQKPYGPKASLWVMEGDGSHQAPLLTDAPNAVPADPSWSPTGTQIAYSATSHGETDLYIANADGSGAHDITNSSGWDLTPAWSPDGTTIAFASYRHGSWDIYLVHPDGSNLRRVTGGTGDDFDPSWSPDGASLVFSHTVGEAGSKRQVAVKSVDPRGRIDIITSLPVDHFGPVFDPTGKWIAYSVSGSPRGAGIVVQRADGSHPVRVSARGEELSWGIAP